MTRPYLFLLLAVASAFLLSSFTTGAPEKEIALPTEFRIPPGLQNMSAQDYLSLTPKKYKQLTGEKMSIKEVIALKMAQKELKKSMNAGDSDNRKSQLVALLLVLFVGLLGVHRFYL